MAYNTTAKGLSALGRKGDNTLIHVSKDELAGLQSLLGPLSTNPHTGLPEAFAWKDVLTTALIGIAGAYTGGAAGALAPEFSGLIGTAVGSGQGALLGGALSASEGKGFGSGALGGAISGGIGGYGGATLPGAEAPTSAISKGGIPYNEVSPSLTQTVHEPFYTTPEVVVPKATEGMSFTPKYGLEQSISKGMPVNEKFGLSSEINPDAASILGTSQPTPPAAPSYWDALGPQASKMGSNKGLSGLLYPVGTGTALGTAATDMIQQNAAYKKQAEQEQAQADANAQDQQNYFASLGYDLAPLSTLNNPSHSAQRDYYLNILNHPRGAATGGSMNVQIPMGGTPVSFTLPPKYGSMVEKLDIPYEQNEIKNELGLANGGYVNTQPINPNAFYPQSQIASARPYPASTPQRHEVIQGFEDGGMLDGPGDGMSDDIPANIDGEEEIRLADGEFVVPPDLVRMLGYGDPEKGAKLLDNLLPIVRQAAHGKKTQIKQNAGRLAAEKMLARAAKGKA